MTSSVSTKLSNPGQYWLCADRFWGKVGDITGIYTMSIQLGCIFVSNLSQLKKICSNVLQSRPDPRSRPIQHWVSNQYGGLSIFVTRVGFFVLHPCLYIADWQWASNQGQPSDVVLWSLSPLPGVPTIHNLQPCKCAPAPWQWSSVGLTHWPHLTCGHLAALVKGNVIRQKQYMCASCITVGSVVGCEYAFIKGKSMFGIISVSFHYY